MNSLIARFFSPKDQTSSENQQKEIQILHEEIKILREELENSKRLAQIGTMAASIAHEIKNPLVAIKTFFDLLPSKYQDVEFREEFSLIGKREVERINEIVTHLLDFARPKKPVFEKVDILQVIQETLKLLSIQIKDAKVGLNLELEDHLPLVLADPEQIRRVFMNLCLNSIQAMHSGGHMSIKAYHNGKSVNFDFYNNGPEIQPEDLERIFDPFFSTKHKGSGLGLAICQKIISDHNGKIEVQSDSSGTSFCLKLPTC